MGRTLLIALAAALLATSAAGQTDPYDARLNQAKQLRVAGNLAGSERVVQEVLRQSPGHFRATYTLGLIQLDRGQSEAGVRTLNAAVTGLKGRPAPDPTIYNTLGWAQMKAGRFEQAEAAFKLGYADRARLTPASRQKLLNNMSLLYRLKGQPGVGKQYVQEAARAGSPQAQTTLQQMRAN